VDAVSPASRSKVDTSTTYLGLRLAHPFVAGASPLSADLDGARRLEDGGAAAIVLHSLYEEQITEAASGFIHGAMPVNLMPFASRLESFPPPDDYPLQPDKYLEHLRRVKAALKIPVIASLNGTGSGAWLQHATMMEDAGADALEVNFYEVVSDARLSAASAEAAIVRAVVDLKGSLRIPVAIKLGPFYSSFANLAMQLEHAGVDGLVLFNRFYQPDIDIDTLSTVSHLQLSSSAELLLRLRWIANLHGRIRASLAASGGVATWSDGVKAILAGAHIVQIVSALLRQGPECLTTMVSGLTSWMEERGMSSIDDMRGRVSLRTVADPMLFERANYIRDLQTWGR